MPAESGMSPPARATGCGTWLVGRRASEDGSRSVPVTMEVPCWNGASRRNERMDVRQSPGRDQRLPQEDLRPCLRNGAGRMLTVNDWHPSGGTLFLDDFFHVDRPLATVKDRSRSSAGEGRRAARFNDA
jgi:hypothetical protein